MPETPDETLAQPPAADLNRYTKAELIQQLLEVTSRADQLADQLADQHHRRDARDGHPPPVDSALCISALLDLHRTVGTASGATIRGRKANGFVPRYLEAAKHLGEQLCNQVLGAEPASD